MTTTKIYIEYFKSPIGLLTLGAVDEGLCLLEFEKTKKSEKKFGDIEKQFHGKIIEMSHPVIQQTKQELEEYFAGKRKKFNIPLLTFGTDFQKKSWDTLRKIPYGTTWSYKQEAEKIGSPKAVRAVGSANGKNRIGIIIPCHRVIGNDGGLGGFGGGIETKKWLLKLEGVCK